MHLFQGRIQDCHGGGWCVKDYVRAWEARSPLRPESWFSVVVYSWGRGVGRWQGMIYGISWWEFNWFHSMFILMHCGTVIRLVLIIIVCNWSTYVPVMNCFFCSSIKTCIEWNQNKEYEEEKNCSIYTAGKISCSISCSILALQEARNIKCVVNPLKTIWFCYNTYFPLTAARVYLGLVFNGLKNALYAHCTPDGAFMRQLTDNYIYWAWKWVDIHGRSMSQRTRIKRTTFYLFVLFGRLSFVSIYCMPNKRRLSIDN